MYRYAWKSVILNETCNTCQEIDQSCGTVKEYGIHNRVGKCQAIANYTRWKTSECVNGQEKMTSELHKTGPISCGLMVMQALENSEMKYLSNTTSTL